MRPQPRSFIPGRKAFTSRKTESRLTDSTLRHCSKVISSIAAVG
jgi:hypothetical protein